MNCQNKSSISGLTLEQKILDELNTIVENYCQSEDICLADIHTEQLKTLEKKLSALNNQYNSAKERLVKMYKDKLDGIISDEDYSLFRQSLNDEEQQLSELIAEVKQKISECHKRQENAAEQKLLIEKHTRFDKLDCTIADEFIDYIEIGIKDENGSREIHIHWKI